MPLLGMAFLVSVAQPIGLWLLLQQMGRVPWLIEKTPLLTVLHSAGALSAVGGAWLALAERRDNRLVAALSLLPLGDALIGFGLGTRVALIGALLAIITRALGVTLMSGGLSLVRHHFERRWQAVGIVAILAGGWALAGLPPSLGSVARWSIYRDLENPALLIALVGASAAGLFALLRFALPLIAGSAIGAEEKTETKILPYLGTLVIAVLFLAVLITGLVPNLVVDPLQAALASAELFK
jgi:formate hydrogenlyase subunit 3/multisubunit Na+/H+ antiporter MnhD subunit